MKLKINSKNYLMKEPFELAYLEKISDINSLEGEMLKMKLI